MNKQTGKKIKQRDYQVFMMFRYGHSLVAGLRKGKAMPLLMDVDELYTRLIVGDRRCSMCIAEIDWVS